MSRARPLPPSGDRLKAVMVGVIGRVMVISPYAGYLVECRIPNFTAHLLDVRDRPKSTSLNYFFCLPPRSRPDTAYRPPRAAPAGSYKGNASACGNPS